MKPIKILQGQWSPTDPDKDRAKEGGNFGRTPSKICSPQFLLHNSLLLLKNNAAVRQYTVTVI